MLFISSLFLALSATAFAKQTARQVLEPACTTLQSGYFTDSNNNAFIVDSSSSSILVEPPPDSNGLKAEFRNCSGSTGYFTELYIPAQNQCLQVDSLVFGASETLYLIIGDCPTSSTDVGTEWKSVSPPGVGGPPPSLYWNFPNEGCQGGLYGIADDISVPGPVQLTCVSTPNTSAFRLGCEETVCPF